MVGATSRSSAPRKLGKTGKRTAVRKGGIAALKDAKLRVEPSTDSMTATRRFEAVMTAAEKHGLLTDKSSRIGGRISPALLKQAKKQTGIDSDTDLIEFALANVALEDGFAEEFKQSRGKIDPSLKLGF